MSDERLSPIPIIEGRRLLEELGFDRTVPLIVRDRYEVWVRGNVPVNLHYAGPPWDPTHFDGEAFANVIAENFPD